MRRYSVAGLCWIGALFGLLPARVSAQSEPPPGIPMEVALADEAGEYRLAIQSAVQGLTEGRYAEALALFRNAHRLAPSARTLRGIAMASFELGEYVEAILFAERALASDVRPLPWELREQTESLSRRASAFVAHYDLEISPAGATLRVDGLRTELDPVHGLFVDLGRHVLRVEAPEYTALEETVMVRGGERTQLTLRLGPIEAQAPRPQTPRDVGASADLTTAHILLGASAITAAVAIGTWGWYATRLDAVQDCEARCTNAARLDELRDGSLVLSVALTSAAVAVGVVGVVVWVLTEGSRSGHSNACTPTPSGVRCDLEWL